MHTAKELFLSEQDYLTGEETAEFKHEYINGEVWAMVGASDAHVTIAMNLAFLLKQKLKDSPCRSYISDMKVKVASANAYFYPDVLVSCEQKDKQNTHYKEYPVFIAEILSPSTEAYDRGDKFKLYRQLASLEEYWLIDAQKMSLDCFTRQQNNDWSLHSYEQASQILQLPTLKLSIQLTDLYESVLDLPQAG